MVTDQFWLSWVEMVMNEVVVDLVGDREISTILGEVLGGDGFSQLGQVKTNFGGRDPPTSGFEGEHLLLTAEIEQVIGQVGSSQLVQANRVFWVFGHHCVGSPPTAKFNYIFTGRL